MDYIAQPKDYWIAPNAIHISLNALGDANRIQCSVASGAVIMCWIKNVEGLGYDNTHQYKTWPISIAPTYFNSDTVKYVYAAIPRTLAIGVNTTVVFPAEQLDIYGKTESGEQIGSTDYYYIWLQGVISEVQTSGNTSARQWVQMLNDGLLDTDQARDAKVNETAWYSYSTLTEIVTFLKNIVMNAGASFLNLFLGPNGGKELTSVATDSTTPTSSTTAVVTPAYGLSKVKPDTAQEVISFEKGSTYGDWTQDSSGAGIWMDANKDWHIEGDFLHARKKLTAKEVQIEEVSHIGGAQLLTAASAQCAFVVDKGDYWRCFFVRVGGDGKKITNKWKVNDQAYCNTFNLEQQEDGTIGNHYYWRLVVGCSNGSTGVYDDNTYTIDNVVYNAIDYHYIDLSKSICGVSSSEPKAGDDIVQLGYQGNDVDRQNAIIIAGAGNGSPYIRQFTGIDTFHIPNPDTQIKPGDNKFTGIVNILSGSKLPDGTDLAQTIDELIEGQENWELDVEGLTTGNENLLRNTGFTGDYESGDVETETNVTPDTPIYSPQLKYWECENVSIATTIESATGMSAVIERGYIQQMPTKALEAGEEYCISFKANGGYIYVNVGGYSEAIELSTDNTRKIIKFTCTNSADPFKLSGSCQVMDIQLTKGNIPNADWIPSPLDNDKAISKFQDLVYLTNAITNANTTILGGLILSQMIRVGNYRDGIMTQETGGMSGLYQSGNSPFLWGGGDMEKAFYTIGKYANNPSYQASDEEVAQMAKFVVTHGGRAILNDIILRGYIYAVGGYFKGNLEIGSQDKFLVDSAKGELRMNGYSMVQDLPNYPVDPTSDKIDLLKLFYQVNQDSLARIARLLLNSHDGSISLDAAYGLHGTDGSASPTTVKTSIQDGFEHKTPLANASLGDGELVLYDKVRDIETRFDGTSIRWFHNGVQTMGGVIDVDANGFLKVLLD